MACMLSYPSFPRFHNMLPAIGRWATATAVLSDGHAAATTMTQRRGEGAASP